MSIWQRMKPARREWVLVFLASTLLLVWSSVPVWTGQALQTERLAFVGTFFDAPDHSAHIAMIHAGMQGEWAYSFRFTSEPHKPQYTRLFYLFLGQLNRILHLDPEVLFEASRWCLGYAALFSVFLFARRSGLARGTAWLAFLLAVLGSGTGFLQVILGFTPGSQVPVDLWLIDAYMLFSLAIFPHFSFTLAMICLALAAFLDYLASPRWINMLAILIAAGSVQLVNPLGFLLADVAMGAAALVTWWQNRKVDRGHIAALLVIAGAQVPLLAYNYIILVQDAFGKLYTLQHATPSPGPIYYFLGFALFWPPAAVGAIQAFKERDRVKLGMLAWIAAAFLLAYAPLVIQRRFLLGVTIPLGLLAAAGIETSLKWLEQKRPVISQRIALVKLAAMLLICANTLFLFPAFALHLSAHPPEYFYLRSLDRAFAWIAHNSGKDDILLAAGETARLAAQKTGRRVYMGHPMETLYFDEKTRVVSAFFNGEGTGDWLGTQPIQWVIYGPYERELAPHFAPGPNLQPVFQEQDVEVFRVRR